MKKLLTILILCLSISLGLFLVACNSDNGNAGNENGDGNHTKLSAPANLAANKQTQILNWSVVSGANGYIVAINDKTNECPTNEYDLNGLTANETYNIKVKAKSSNETQNSEWSAKIEYIPLTRLDTPSNIAINDGILSWNTVPNTLGYAVVINGTTTIVDKALCNLSEKFDLPNVFGIKIKAIGNEYFADSLFSVFYEYDAYVKLDTPEITKLAEESYNDKSQTMLNWSKIDNAVSYTIKITNIYKHNNYVATSSIIVKDGDIGLNFYSSGYSFDLKTVSSLNIAILNVEGQGSISIKANANGLYSESDWAAPKTFDCVRLKTPVIRPVTHGSETYLYWNYQGVEINWVYSGYIVRIESSAIPGGEMEFFSEYGYLIIKDVLTIPGNYRVYVGLAYSMYSSKSSEDFINCAAENYEYKANACWFFNSAWSNKYDITIS